MRDGLLDRPRLAHTNSAYKRGGAYSGFSMRSRAQREDVPFVVDVAIAIGLVFAVTLFTIVTEFCIGRGELTRAQLNLLAAPALVAHAAAAPSVTIQKTNQGTQGEKKWLLQ